MLHIINVIYNYYILNILYIINIIYHIYIYYIYILDRFSSPIQPASVFFRSPKVSDFRRLCPGTLRDQSDLPWSDMASPHRVLKCWVSPTNPWGFPTKNGHFGVFWGMSLEFDGEM